MTIFMRVVRVLNGDFAERASLSGCQKLWDGSGGKNGDRFFCGRMLYRAKQNDPMREQSLRNGGVGGRTGHARFAMMTLIGSDPMREFPPRLQMMVMSLLLWFVSGCASWTPNSQQAADWSWIGAWEIRRDDTFGMVILFENGKCVNAGGFGSLDSRLGIWRGDSTEAVAVFDKGGSLILKRFRDQVIWEDGSFEVRRLRDRSQIASRITGPEAGFAGLWRLNPEPDGQYFQVMLGPRGFAASSIREQGPGTWEIVGERAVVRWPDGWWDEISESNGKFWKESWAPGLSLDAEPVDRWIATRLGMD